MFSMVAGLIILSGFAVNIIINDRKRSNEVERLLADGFTDYRSF